MLSLSPLKFRVFQFPCYFYVNSLNGLNLQFINFALNRNGLAKSEKKRRLKEVPNLCIYLLDVYMFFCYTHFLPFQKKEKKLYNIKKEVAKKVGKI